MRGQMISGSTHGAVCPVFPTMPNAKNAHPPIVIDQIDYDMSVDWMDAHRRGDFISQPRHLRMISNQLNRVFDLILIGFSLDRAEALNAFEINLNQIGFRLGREAVAHSLTDTPALARAILRISDRDLSLSPPVIASSTSFCMAATLDARS